MSTPAPRDWWLPRPATPARPAVRIGDAEREDAVAALGEHFATGRLTREEYDDRAGSALAARTAGDVAPLFRDLPLPHPAVLTGGPPRGVGASGTPARGPVRSVPGRRPVRLPLMPMVVMLVGLAMLLDEAAVLFVGLALLWWVAAVRVRRHRDRWAARFHGCAPHRAHPYR